MKRMYVVLLMMVLGGFIASAHPVFSGHPADSSAALIGTFRVSIEIECPESLYLFTGGNRQAIQGTTGQVSTQILVWLTSGNQIEFVLDAAAITVDKDDCNLVSNLSTSEIFSLLSRAAVAEAAERGWVDSVNSCSSPDIRHARIYQPRCVVRSGSGRATHFASCNESAYSMNEYGICCPGGPPPTITRISGSSSGACANGNCELTTE